MTKEEVAAALGKVEQAVHNYSKIMGGEHGYNGVEYLKELRDSIVLLSEVLKKCYDSLAEEEEEEKCEECPDSN